MSRNEDTSFLVSFSTRYSVCVWGGGGKPDYDNDNDTKL